MRPTMLRKLRGAPTPAPFGVCRNSCTLTSAPAARSDSRIQRSARDLPSPPWLRGPIAHSSTRRRYALSSSNRGGFVGGATSRAEQPASAQVASATTTGATNILKRHRVNRRIVVREHGHVRDGRRLVRELPRVLDEGR